jgi:anti-sigma factor ChrR (cupin superfamily)
MLLNADVRQRVVVNTHALDWTPSPTEGVQRRLLERGEGDAAVATYLVRYAPGSHYPHHAHDLDEELLVLEGALHDELGRYGAGTYILNPRGSSHAPFSQGGCTLLVKLNRVRADDARLVVDTTNGGWQGPPEGVRRMSLFGAKDGINAYVSRFAPGARVPHHAHPGGEELFVLEGEIRDELGSYPAGTWIRQPHGSEHAPFSEKGALVLVRRGYLAP